MAISKNSSASHGPSNFEEPQGSGPTIELIAANNEFAIKFFREVDSSRPASNQFLSPFSIESALLMTMEGARHQTSSEMGAALGLSKRLQRQGAAAGWDLTIIRQEMKSILGQFSRLDSNKDSQVQLHIEELRKKLDTANSKGNELLRGGKATEGLEQGAIAKKLADQINQLASKVTPYELHIANGIWAEKTLPVEPAFIDIVRDAYGAAAKNVDFKGAADAERLLINDWISGHTNHKIKDMIKPRVIDASTRMVLANAVYFKGTWKEPFNEKSTLPKDFFNRGSEKTTVATMSKSLESGRYGAFNADGSPFDTPKTLPEQAPQSAGYPDKGFHAVELPYNGDEIAMTILLPMERDGLVGLMKVLTPDRVRDWNRSMNQRQVQLQLPKFKIETQYDLNASLIRLGMKSPFDPEVADFSGMCSSANPDHRLYISKVLHNAFVEVNEKGTEAAAATVVMMAPRSAAIRQRPFVPSFVADHPFLFLIHNRRNGLILFLGKVESL